MSYVLIKYICTVGVCFGLSFHSNNTNLKSNKLEFWGFIKIYFNWHMKIVHIWSTMVLVIRFIL